jgi:hypothetical protein
MGRVLSAKFCIVDGEGRFWGGAHWVSEYPDAQTYITLKAAKTATERARLTRSCAVVDNYGFENERIMFRAETKA